MQAFDHLLALEILVPVADSALSKQGQLREYMSVQLVLSKEQISKAVQNYPNCPTDLVRWATSHAIA